MQRRVPHAGAQPPARHRTADPQPGPVVQAAAQLLRVPADVRQKGPGPDQDDPRPAERAG